jgi:uncharacterized iron-regulated membrane protein
VFGISKNVGILIGILALLAAIAFGGWMTFRTISGMIEHAETRATDLERAKWQTEIEKSNAAANKQVADQAKRALEIETDANQRVTEATQAYEELRKRNEALPNGTAVGLDAARGQLLPD